MNASGKVASAGGSFSKSKTFSLFMQRIKQYIIAAAICGLSATASVSAQVRFDNVRHEFGTLLWHAPGKATFKIFNDSKEPLTIKDVHPDCGCTLVDWTKKPIQPGEYGFISATFDAELLGHFEKQVAVYTNLKEKPFYLTLSGSVAQTLNSGKTDLPYHVGDLYLETDNVEFDDVYRGDNPVKEVRVYNSGRQSITPQLMHLPKYLKVVSEPEVIRPGRSGRLYLTLNSELLRNYGLTQTSVYVSRFAGDRVSRDNELNISATLLPEQEYTDEQLSTAPSAVIDSTTIHFNFNGSTKRQKREVKLTNAGQSPLVVTALQVYNPGLSVSIGKRTLKPGQSDKLKISTSPTNQGFKGRRRVLLITNDPVNPKIIIDIIIKK